MMSHLICTAERRRHFSCALPERNTASDIPNINTIFFTIICLSSSADFWKRENTHSAEQQLALVGFVGVPVDDKPKSRLTVPEKNAEEMNLFLQIHEIEEEKIALIHPAAAFDTKQWATENFAKVIDYLASRGIFSRSSSPRRKNENVINELAEKTSEV